jgi:hypothetical protein
MRRLATPLFAAGLLLQAAGFAGHEALRARPLARLLSPAYARASDGLARLAAAGQLGAGERGFGELAGIFAARLREQNDPSTVARVTVVKFAREAAGGPAGPTRERQAGPVAAILSNRQSLRTSVVSLARGVDGLRRGLPPGAAAALFLAGAALSAGAFLAARRSRRPA